MKVRRGVLVLGIIMIIFASGCLVRQPAKVTFSIDKTVVQPGGTLHLIVTINNTGKVGLVGATLLLGNDNFQIVQTPTFPSVLKVGQSVQLIWILKAPSRPGKYSLPVSLELRDELKRTWTGFYGHFIVIVSKSETPAPGINITVNAPSVVRGGENFPITVEISNNYDSAVTLVSVSLRLLPGMRVLSSPTVPTQLSPHHNVTLTYAVSAPYAYRSGLASVVVEYIADNVRESRVKSFNVTVLWQPWRAKESTLKAAYGKYYAFVTSRYIVDAYWNEKFKSTSRFNPEDLKPKALSIVHGAKSASDAGVQLYDWILSSYYLNNYTDTLQPNEILNRTEISYTEAQILMTAMLRSLNIPARVVSLFNGTDCTIDPVTEFYTGDGWYVADFRHGFIGTLDEYLASPYFPRIYQLVTMSGYRIVAQDPLKLKGHEHIDVTDQFLNDLEDRLTNVIIGRLKPQLRSKLDLVLNGMPPSEQLYALFVFASAPNEASLNEIFETWSVKRIQENIKALYEFYHNLPWRDDFTYYWMVFTGEV